MRTLHASYLFVFEARTSFYPFVGERVLRFYKHSIFLTESGCGNAHGNWHIHIHEEDRVCN